jgi:hypothetical protein
VDSDRDTITLPEGHGLVHGQLVTYSRGAGPALTIAATGVDDNFAQAESGTGGVIAGASADADTNTVSTTQAWIGKGSSLSVKSVDLDALHTSVPNSKVDSILATVVGGGGASVNNHVWSDVIAEVKPVASSDAGA